MLLATLRKNKTREDQPNIIERSNRIEQSNALQKNCEFDFVRVSNKIESNHLIGIRLHSISESFELTCRDNETKTKQRYVRTFHFYLRTFAKEGTSVWYGSLKSCGVGYRPRSLPYEAPRAQCR